jgi:hypothetical protein
VPDSPGGALSNPLLRGLFGVLQSGAAEGRGTAQIWQDLRTAAGTWQFQAQGLPQPYDPAAVTEAGRAILSAQGINGATVSSFRGVAGQWLGAKQRVTGADLTANVTAQDVFRPPWAMTTNPAVPDRFRIRTQWQFDTGDGGTATAWKTDEITAPLTTIGDALSQASLAPPTQSAPANALAAQPPVLTDYEIEQV